MLPKVSITGACRVSTCWREIRQTPNAMNTVKMTVNSSGISAIVRLMPESAPWSQF